MFTIPCEDKLKLRLVHLNFFEPPRFFILRRPDPDPALKVTSLGPESSSDRHRSRLSTNHRDDAAPDFFSSAHMIISPFNNFISQTPLLPLCEDPFPVWFPLSHAAFFNDISLGRESHVTSHGEFPTSK